MTRMFCVVIPPSPIVDQSSEQQDTDYQIEIKHHTRNPLSSIVFSITGQIPPFPTSLHRLSHLTSPPFVTNMVTKEGDHD